MVSIRETGKTSEKQNDNPALVRPFRAGDAASVWRLEHPQEWPPPPKILQNMERREHDPAFNRLYVAEHDGQIVGKVGVELSFPPYGELQNLIIDPGFRRQGIASHMIRWCEALAVEQGVSLIHLQTEADNQPALALYQKCGYFIAIPPNSGNLMVLFHFLYLSVLSDFLNLHPTVGYKLSQAPFSTNSFPCYALRWEDTTSADVLTLYVTGGPSGGLQKPLINGGWLVEEHRNVEILMLPGPIGKLSLSAKKREGVATLTPGKEFEASLVIRNLGVKAIDAQVSLVTPEHIGVRKVAGASERIACRVGPNKESILPFRFEFLAGRDPEIWHHIEFPTVVISAWVAINDTHFLASSGHMYKWWED